MKKISWLIITVIISGCKPTVEENLNDTEILKIQPYLPFTQEIRTDCQTDNDCKLKIDSLGCGSVISINSNSSKADFAAFMSSIESKMAEDGMICEAKMNKLDLLSTSKAICIESLCGFTAR